MSPDEAFAQLPKKLRHQLMKEFGELRKNFSSGKWQYVGLHAGRFSEAVFTILSGIPSGQFSDETIKPKNFPASCTALEKETGLPRGLRFIATRIISSLYEMRNNRDIGHVAGDIDPSYMDAVFAMQNAKWVMAELIRAFQDVSGDGAQAIVDNISAPGGSLLWQEGGVRRVLAKVPPADEILLLLDAAGGRAKSSDLLKWADRTAKSTIYKKLAELHASKMVDRNVDPSFIVLLPPGMKRVEEIMLKLGSQ